MKIDKEIISKVEREYFFISGILDIDAKYFKKRIDEGVQHSTYNYRTNVQGMMTDFFYFNKDKNFKTVLLQILDYLDQLNFPLKACKLDHSWGIIEKFGDYTQRHDHIPAYFSGNLYLNDHHQKLYFPEIKQEITPKKGRFVIFSSFLLHHTKRNLRDTAKYAIAFNFITQ